MSNDSNDTAARKGFIAQMESSGIAPTWETIYELNATIAGLRAERDRIQQGAADADNNICQILGGVLGYPTGEDGEICVGDHVAETLAAEAVRLIDSLRGQLIEAQASMSFLQRQTAAAQADERARRDAALNILAKLYAILATKPELSQFRRSMSRLAIEAICALTGQDEEERREEAAGK